MGKNGGSDITKDPLEAHGGLETCHVNVLTGYTEVEGQQPRLLVAPTGKS